jgi:hypothetical protein
MPWCCIITCLQDASCGFERDFGKLDLVQATSGGRGEAIWMACQEIRHQDSLVADVWQCYVKA